jgi:hypothetical protein
VSNIADELVGANMNLMTERLSKVKHCSYPEQ